MNSSFGNGHSLLLHHLMNSDAIVFAHLVELINRYKATISKNHSSRLEFLFAGFCVRCHCRSETYATTTAPCR